MRSSLTAITLALAAGVMWGTLGLITHYLLNYGVSIIQLGILRLGGAFVLTLLIAIMLGRIHILSLRQWGGLAAIGLVCQALSSISFSSAVAGIGSSLAIIMLCTGPLFTVAINRIFYSERLDTISLLMVLLGLAGLTLTVLHSQGEQTNVVTFSRQWLYGLGWGLLSGGCYGLFPLFTRSLGKLDSWVIVSFSLGLGAAFLAPLQGSASVDLSLHSNISVWILVVALILVPTVMADVLYVRAIAAGGPVLATVFALIEIPASVLFSRWWLAVPVTAMQWAGIFFFCTGLTGLALRHNQNSSPFTKQSIISITQKEKHHE
ncbi:DMT family transporter [Enterobacter sp. JBIWA008]|uniref:Membrane protein n=2 Tax=Enterobacter TaxID=547 RepID=A0A455VZ67_ENTAS|nr:MULTISPECIES: DMT family transporter [Enterobacter]UAN39544.1 DMT family transporter [Enterobacter sp. JBIWA008]BBI96386.1 membrane protein [Enterobacter asburiae]BBJ59541.1 membrane protein [Enterobacter asburiae]BEK75217.1 DMT family transporter [Enterobacter asburiae]HDR2661190.1 DMT family transporter [Enterobacter asburiae]